MAESFATRAQAMDYLARALPEATAANPKYLTKADGTVSQWLTESVRFAEAAGVVTVDDARAVHADQGRQDDGRQARRGVLARRRDGVGIHRARRRDAGGRPRAWHSVHLRQARLRRGALGRRGVAGRQDRYFGAESAKRAPSSWRRSGDSRPLERYRHASTGRTLLPGRPLTPSEVRDYQLDRGTAAEQFSQRFLDRLAALNALVRESGETIEGGLFYWDRVADFDDRRPTRASPRRGATCGAPAASSARCWRSASTPATRALLCLSANADLVWHGVDICEHAYVEPCVDYLAREFPGRVHLFAGDSREVLPRLATHRPELDFDLFHVDGGHTDMLCRADMSNCLRLARGGRGKHLVLDDINASWIFDVYCEYVVARACWRRRRCSPTGKT